MRWWLALVCLTACGTPSLISATSQLELPATLSFDRTWVGHSSEQRLRILSRSRVGAELPVSTDAPFSVDVAVVSVSGGEGAELVVRFAPTAPGPVSGVLHVGEVDVQLSGEAALPPACPADEPCRRFRFDPVSGACVEAQGAEGEACEGDPCVENGRCAAGVCVGSARSCDDGNACTRDACAAGLGCEHTDVTDACPAASDPCLAPACDPARGCLTAPVPDGTACGELSCTQANVCMQGRCVALVPPDGFTCAPETPCQGRGTCRAQHCERPAARVLAPAWTYTPDDALLLFDGVADPQGNFYWVECVAGETMSCGAVSFTGSGLERFRSGAVTGMNTARAAQLFDEGRFVFLTSNGQVTALSGADGRVLWSVDVRAALGNGGVSELLSLQLVSDGHGGLWVSAVPRVALVWDLESPHSLVQLDAATGAVRAAFVEVANGFVVADESGNAYATAPTGDVVSWSPSAQQRFVAPVRRSWSPVLAACAGTVLTAGNAQLAVPSLGVTTYDASNLAWDGALQLAGARTVRLRRPVFPSSRRR